MLIVVSVLRTVFQSDSHSSPKQVLGVKRRFRQGDSSDSQDGETGERLSLMGYLEDEDSDFEDDSVSPLLPGVEDSDGALATTNKSHQRLNFSLKLIQ